MDTATRRSYVPHCVLRVTIGKAFGFIGGGFAPDAPMKTAGPGANAVSVRSAETRRLASLGSSQPPEGRRIPNKRALRPTQLSRLRRRRPGCNSGER